MTKFLKDSEIRHPHPRNIPPIVPSGIQERAKCPTCGMNVRIIRRIGGLADHLEPSISLQVVGDTLAPQDPEIALELDEERAGKKTIALVGMAQSSCATAPFDRPSEQVEIWGLNEAHAFPWMKRADRWFQIHSSKSWKRYIAKRDVVGHLDWLKKNEWDIPIYMQFLTHLVPKSIGYPLYDVVHHNLHNFKRGRRNVKYFTSTFAYMMGIALMPEEKVERIEIYGFDMSDKEEYIRQKACGEFWIGLAMGRGIEVWTPDNCQILYSDLYGGDEQGAGWDAT